MLDTELDTMSISRSTRAMPCIQAFQSVIFSILFQTWFWKNCRQLCMLLGDEFLRVTSDYKCNRMREQVENFCLEERVLHSLVEPANLYLWHKVCI